MNPPTPLLIPFVITVAALLIIALFIRKKRVDAFKEQCDLLFEATVRYNENLSHALRKHLTAVYRRRQPSYWLLLLSGAPLYLQVWYNQEEIDALFRIN